MGFLSGLNRRAVDVFEDEPGLWTSSWNAPQQWLQGFRDTGIVMTPDLAMTVSAVWAGVTFMARNMGSLPLELFRHSGLDGEVSQLIRSGPTARVISRQSNRSHTALEFWEMGIGHVLLRGNMYARIVEGSRSFAEELRPIHPDRVTPTRLPDGVIVYVLQFPNGNREALTEDEMFHVRGFMSDGLVGISLTDVAARSLGGAVAADSFAARFFKSGAAASVVAQYQGEHDDQTEKDLHASIGRYLSGLQNVGGVLVVDQDTTVTKLGINPQEAQMLATREHGVREVARWLGLPTQVLADAGKEPTHASAEVFADDIVRWSFSPFGRRIEQAVDRDLLLEDDLFTRYNFDAIRRGDMKARGAFYQLAVLTGWMNRQEVRHRENLNPGPPELEEFLEPRNMVQAGDGDGENGNGNGRNGARALVPVRAAARAQDAGRTMEVIYALELAGRVARRELTAVDKAVRRFAKDGAGWSGWLREFYGEHAIYVSESLKIPISRAREYAARQGFALEQQGNAADTVGDWQQTLAPDLATLMLSDGRAEGEQHHA